MVKPPAPKPAGEAAAGAVDPSQKHAALARRLAAEAAERKRAVSALVGSGRATKKR